MMSHNTNFQRKTGCLLFYVYAYFFGICSGVIAVSLAFTEVTSVESRTLLVVALTLSVLAFMGHVVMSRHIQTLKVVQARTFVVSLGLLMSSVLSALAAYFNRNLLHLLFVCCVVYSAVFAFACVAYVANVRLQWKRQNLAHAQFNVTFIPASAFLNFNHARMSTILRRCAETLPSEESSAHRGSDSSQSLSRGAVILHLPADCDLPSYEELDFTDPPKYSEIAATALTVESDDHNREAILKDSDLPPKYDDVISAAQEKDDSERKTRNQAQEVDN